MLSHTRASRLCRRCHNDLVVLYERGFCGPAAATRPLPPRLSSKAQNTRNARYLSQAALRRQHLPRDKSLGTQNKQDHSGTTDTEVVNDQLEALHELEKLLGRPIEDAIEEDQLNVDHVEDEGLTAGEPEMVVEAADNPIAMLRETGASEETIAREVRMIFGERLPEGLLEEGELKIYKRLYGEPAQDIEEEIELLVDEAEAVGEIGDPPPQALLDRHGEEVEYRAASETDALAQEPAVEDLTEVGGVDLPDRRGITVDQQADAKLRAKDIAQSLGGDVVDEDVDSELYEEGDVEETEERSHPMTALGKFATSPRTVFMPQEGFVRPVERIMGNFSNKHLKEMCERTFGGPGLPDSPLTPRSGQTRQQLPLPLEAAQHQMGEMEANAFVTSIMPPTLAAIASVLVETRKRLGSSWLAELLAKEGGPRVLDAGAGGAGIIAWREIVQAHWASLHTSDRNAPPPPASKAVVLTGSEKLRHRAADMLDNTTFIPRLPDYVHARDMPTLEDNRQVQPRKQFDVIIAPHTLFGLKEEWMRKQQVQNLWSLLNPNGGVLILIEKGVPRGFEAIAGARELLLERYIASPEGRKTKYDNTILDEDTVHNKVTGMILAPCTNHEECPMYKIPGASRGRKDFCSFQQRYIRPAFLQRVLGAKDRNHDDVDFSYISVIKGKDLRSKHLTTWSTLQDPTSAPSLASTLSQSEQPEPYQTWMDMSQRGFSDFTPSAVASASPASQPATSFEYPDGLTRPSLPALHHLPRIVYPPLKRRGHVTMDLCTPAGQIERWTIPKSFSRQAYRDARKSRWGDLWALGAKTRTARNLRLGGPGTKEGMRSRGRENRIQDHAMALRERMEEERLADMEEQRDLERTLSDADDGDEDDQVDDALREWEDEYERDRKRYKGKKGGAFEKFGKASKEAKRTQKQELQDSIGRERQDRDVLE